MPSIELPPFATSRLNLQYIAIIFLLRCCFGRTNEQFFFSRFFWYGFDSVGGCIRFVSVVALYVSQCSEHLWLALSRSALSLSVLATYRVEFTSLRLSKFRVNGISANRNVVLNTAHISKVLNYFANTLREKEKSKK